MQHHVIYVPGILDDIYYLQGSLVRTWRLRGIHSHTHEIPWAGNEMWEPKFKQLLSKIDKHVSQGHKISLVGASAGASAVLNAYVERADKISGLVYICGKINEPENVIQKTYDENPAFKTSLYELQTNLPKLRSADKAKMLSLYSPIDKMVPHPDTLISGIEERLLPSLNHGKVILYALGPGAGRILNFLKQKAKD